MPNISDGNQNGNGQPLSAEQTAPEPIPNARSKDEFAAEINQHFHNSVEDIHAIGRLLLEAKIELDSHLYKYMLHKQLDFGERNARLYIRVARNPVLVKRKYISAQPSSLTKLVELTKLPVDYLERQFEREKITPKIEIDTIKEWVEEQKNVRFDWDNAPAHMMWMVDHFIPQYPEAGPQHARRFVSEDGFTFADLTTLKDWIVKLHAAHLEWQEERRRHDAEDERMIEEDEASMRLQARAAQLGEWEASGAGDGEAEEDHNGG